MKPVGLGHQAGDTCPEMCSGCLVAPSSGRGALCLSPYLCSHLRLPSVPKGFSQSHHKPLAAVSFTRLSPRGWGSRGWVGLWEDRADLWEVTAPVTGTERGVPWQGAVYNVIPQQLLQRWPWAVSACGFMALSSPSVTPLMAWRACSATFPCHPVPPQHTHTHTHTHIGELSHMAPSHPHLLGLSWGTVGTGAWQGGPGSPEFWE